MKIKTAIKYFEDEIRFCERAPALNGCDMTKDWLLTLEASKLAVKALRAMQDKCDEEPLTLEELQQMIGEPVWVVDKHWGSERWEIVGESLLGLYGGFDAYRHRPEEGPSHGNKETM